MRKNIQHILLSKASEKKGNKQLAYQDFGAGFPPYLRGTHATMYVRKPWEIKQHHYINSAEANEQGQFSGAVQFDAFKAIESPTAPALSNKTISDILANTGCSITLGCELQQAGASTETELAYTLAYGREIIRMGLAFGIKIDDMAQRLIFSFSVGANHFNEIAKMRAARMLWAKIIKQSAPEDENSLALHIHSHTDSQSLTAADPFNNVVRICIAATAAAFGGIQSLHTHAYDTATGQASEAGERLSYTTQLFLQEETKITKTVDPWGGSYYVESLTNEMARKAWALIEETETFGGFFKAIEAGIPQQRMNEKKAL